MLIPRMETGPSRRGPEVVARVGIDLDPVVTDADDARWRASLWPDQPEQLARLEAEMALAATAPPLLLRGDAVDVMLDAFARVPADASSPQRRRCRSSRSRAVCDSCTASTKRRPAGRWRGYQWRGRGHAGCRGVTRVRRADGRGRPVRPGSR